MVNKAGNAYHILTMGENFKGWKNALQGTLGFRSQKIWRRKEIYENRHFTA